MLISDGKAGRDGLIEYGFTRERHLYCCDGRRHKKAMRHAARFRNLLSSMKTKRTIFASVLTGIALATLGACPAQADTVMDQIGTSGAYFSNQISFVSTRFDSPFSTFSSAVVDDFSIKSPFTLTNVTAATLGFAGFTSYSNITGYEVNIYSSLAASNQNINGDVYHLALSPAQVTLSAFAGDTNALSALLSIPVNATLQSGTYYVSVLADLNYSNGEFGIYSTNGVVGSYPSGQNAFIENPSGGFQNAGNQYPLNSDAAYKLSGTAKVPDTGTTVALLGMAVAALALLRRKLLA